FPSLPYLCTRGPHRCGTQSQGSTSPSPPATPSPEASSLSCHRCISTSTEKSAASAGPLQPKNVSDECCFTIPASLSRAEWAVPSVCRAVLSQRSATLLVPGGRWKNSGPSGDLQRLLRL